MDELFWTVVKAVIIAELIIKVFQGICSGLWKVYNDHNALEVGP